MSRLAQRVMFVLAAVFPFGFATVLSALVFFGGTGQFFGHDLSYYGLPAMGGHILPGIGWFAALIGVWAAVYGMARKSAQPIWLWALIIAGLALSVRLALVCLFGDNTLLFSDNGYAWLRAIGEPSPKDYHWTIPSWMNYSLFLRSFAFLFGKRYVVDLAAGAFFGGVTTFLVSVLAFRITGQKAVAVLAASFYAFNPALVAYSLSGTPEHFAITFFLASAYLFGRMVEADTKRGMFLFAIPCGLTLGLGVAIKSIFPLVGTAMALAVLLANVDGKKSPTRRIFSALGALAVVFIVQAGVVRGMTALTEAAFDIRLTDKQSVSHMLVVGLNRQGEGQLGLGELSRTVDNCLRAGMSMEEASREGRRRVLDDWRGHYEEIPGFFMRKFIWGWQDFNRPCRYFQRDVARFLRKHPGARKGWAGKVRGMVYRTFAGAMPVANALVYFCMMAFGTCAAIRRAMDKSGSSTVEIFAALMIVGFFFMLAVIEGQSRYKCLILPFVFIFASQCISELSERVDWKRWRV